MLSGVSSLKSVSVIGDGKAKPGDEVYSVAEKVGFIIGSSGYVLITGGLFGVMEAASKGAKKAGGITVGILPHYESVANSFVDIKVRTGLSQARNVIVVSSSNIIIAVGGGFGTLSEIAHALKIGGKRVLGFKTWGIEGVESYENVESFILSVKRTLS